MSIFAAMAHPHLNTSALARNLNDFLPSDETVNIIDAILPCENNVRPSPTPTMSDQGSFFDPSLDEIPIDGTFSTPPPGNIPNITGCSPAFSNGSCLISQSPQPLASRQAPPAPPPQHHPSHPETPVIKQEPLWGSSSSSCQTPTTPTAALSQLGLGVAQTDPFAAHSFLQHQLSLNRIKTEPQAIDFEAKRVFETTQLRTNSKRRPGPYDNLKDPSGKIKLELIPDEAERNKVKEKRLKNRQAAEKSRKRKKEQTERLETDATRLRIDNEQIVADLARLKQLARKLRAVQSEHEKICEFNQSHQFRQQHQPDMPQLHHHPNMPHSSQHHT